MPLAPGSSTALCVSALLVLGAAPAGAQVGEAEPPAAAEPADEAEPPAAPEPVDEAEPPAPAESVASAERAATARALFSDGLTHAREARFAEAIDRFARAHALRPAPGIAYNLASALARVGRIVEASELFRWVLRHAETPEGMRGAAQASVDMLAPRLASVRLVVSGPTEGLALLLDGAPLAFAAVGVDVPLDPGSHRFEALRGDARVAVREVVLAEGAYERIELTVSPLPAPASPPIEPAVIAEPIREPEPPAEDLSWLAWSGGALAVALAVVVITSIVVSVEQGAAVTPILGTTTPRVLEWD